MPIRHKRELLARAMAAGGAIALIERFARRPCVLAVTYHRIGDPRRRPFYDLVHSATAEDFKTQIELFSSKYRVVSLPEFLAIASAGFRTNEPCVLITFDDGYRDNRELAFPILAEKKTPAVFFLPTRFIDQPVAPWWDCLAFILKTSKCERIVLDEPFGFTLSSHEAPLDERIARVTSIFLARDPGEHEAMLDHLSSRAEVSADARLLGESLFLSWDDAREMQAQGMAFGSHSATHRDLAKLTEAERFAELASSRERLESELGVNIRTLAYPFGRSENLPGDAAVLAERAGFDIAFSATVGSIIPRDADRFRLKRVAVGSADSNLLVRSRLALCASLGRSIL